MKRPLLSIIVPVYNAASSVEKIVLGVLRQNFRDFELILVNDGSTDKTLGILQNIARQDPRVIVISQNNGGPSSARNTGLGKAGGKYVLFLDADDDISPDMLEVLVGEAEKNNSDLISSGWRYDLRKGSKLIKGYKEFSPDQEIVVGSPAEIKKYIIRSLGGDGQLYNLWNKLFRDDIIRKHNLRFREDIRFGEDLIFTFNYAEHVRKISLIPDVLYYYQAESETSVFSKSSLVPEYRHINIEEFEAFVGNKRDQELDDLAQWVKWRWLLSYYRLVSTAKIPHREKTKNIKDVSTGNYVVAENAEFIGKKKLFLEKFANLLRRWPTGAIIVGKLVQSSRASVVFVRILLPHR